MFQTFKSTPAPITETTIIGIPSNYAHCFAGIRFYDETGKPVFEKVTGHVTIEARRVTNGEYSVVDTLDLSNKEEADWAGNVNSVKATPKSISTTTATHYSLVVVCNKT